jgi:hypothetical protein
MAAREFTELAALLTDAGWEGKREGSHTTFHCPCGAHTINLSWSPGSWMHGKSVRATIRRCQAGRPLADVSKIKNRRAEAAALAAAAPVTTVAVLGHATRRPRKTGRRTK